MAGLGTKMTELFAKRDRKRHGNNEDSEEEITEKHENGNTTWTDRLEYLTGRDIDGDGRIGKVVLCTVEYRHALLPSLMAERCDICCEAPIVHCQCQI